MQYTYTLYNQNQNPLLHPSYMRNQTHLQYLRIFLPLHYISATYNLYYNPLHRLPLPETQHIHLHLYTYLQSLYLLQIHNHPRHCFYISTIPFLQKLTYHMLHLIFCITLVKHYVRKKHYFQFDFFGKFHLSLHNLSLKTLL